MNKLKKIFTIILSSVLVFSCIANVSADETSAEILNIYSDGMLFSQNDDAAIEGFAKKGSTIEAILKNSENILISKGITTADSDGRFIVSFPAPQGSFEEYTISLFCNGVNFRTLSNIVFGELWLASGQSNMQYPLSQSKTGNEMYISGKKLSKWLRVLLVPPYPMNNPLSEIPADPQNDIPDAVWVNGENTSIYGMSAVAYFFAQKLMEELDMPIGILNASLGGSSIRSWLSRESIDSAKTVKDYLISKNEYISYDQWSDSDRDIYRDISANFNHKIAPLKNFRPSGMIWYQGETDLMLDNTNYADQFSLMQNSYSEFFGFSDKLIPIIYSQLASYHYSDKPYILSDWNINYTKMQEEAPDSRAVVSIYDVPLTYIHEAGLIHPMCKEEVGERMADSAMGLVYKKYTAYTAATPSSVEIRDNGIYITFKNAGNGLMFTSDSAEGFAICSDDGIYIKADAEIISSDTVRVFSDKINHYAGVSYAYSINNGNANLYSKADDNTFFPVSMFITYSNGDVHYWSEKEWMNCDNEKIWYTENDEFSGYYDSWAGNNTEIKIEGLSPLGENNYLRLISSCRKFSVSPTLNYKDGIENKIFSVVDTDFTDYETISFLIRNNGENDVIFEGLKLYKNIALWYSPEILNTLDCSATIPADGKAYEITLDLNRLYHLGNECSLSYDNEKLHNINNIEFSFSSAYSNSDISIDSINFSAGTQKIGTRYDVDISNADNPIEFFTGIVLFFAGKIISLFR